MELKGHTDGVRCARFFPSNSDRVVTNGSDGMVRFWDSRSDKKLLDDKTIAHRLDTVCVSLDGASVYGIGVINGDDAVEKWDIGTTQRQFESKCGDEINGMKMSRDGTKLISFDWGGIDILDSKTGEVISTYTEFDSVFSAAFSPDGKLYAVGNDFGDVAVCDTATGEIQWQDRVHGGLPANEAGVTTGEFVNSVDFHPNGNLLLSVGLFEKTLVCSKAADGSDVFRRTTDNTDELRMAEFSFDGRQFITASCDGTARVYDVETVNCIVNIHHADIVWDVDFSKDQRSIVTACEDGCARIWDLRVQHGSTKKTAMTFDISKAAKK